MPIAEANGIELCFETFGDRSDPAVLLVSGYTSQLLGWDEGFCAELAARGRFVIRFDNRDVGLSTHLDGQHVDIAAVLAASAGRGEMPPVPYTLSAFSDDGFGLLDHLGIDAAHVMGMSMGGMIVQTMAIEHPERVLSMTSVMSTTGEAEYFQSLPEVMKALMTPPPAERAGYIAHVSGTARLFSSPRYFDQGKAEQKAAAAFDRAKSWIGTISPEGTTGYAEEESRGVWQAGNAAFMRNWPYAYALGQADPNLKDKFDVTPLPKGDGEGARNADTLGGWQLMVNKNSKNIEAATEFVKYLASAEVQKSHSIEFANLPTRPALYDDPDILKVNPYYKPLKDVFSGGAVARPSTVSADLYNDVSVAYFTAVNQILTGSKDSATALADLEKELQKILR